METVRCQPVYAIENLNEIFLRVRPSIVNVWSEIFDQLPREDGAMITISGKDGKSLLSLEIIAKVLTIMSESEEGDAEPEVLLLDTGTNFRIFKLAMIVKEILIKKSANSSDEVIKKILHKFSYQQIDNPYFHILLMTEIERTLIENPNISMVVIDCFGYFYNHVSFLHQQRGDGEESKQMTKVNFYYSMLEKLKIFCKRFNVTFVQVNSNYSKLKFDDKYSDIFLEIADDETSEPQKILTIKNKFNNEIRMVNFVIRNSSRIEFLGEPETISSYRYVDRTNAGQDKSSQDDDDISDNNE